MARSSSGKISRTRRRNGRWHHLPRADAGELVRRARRDRPRRGGVHRTGQVQLQPELRRRSSSRPWGRRGTPALPSTSAGPWSRPSPASPSTATTGLTTTRQRRPRRRAEDRERGGQQRDARQVRRRVHRSDVDQHHAEVPVDVKAPSTRNGQKCAAGTPDAGKVGVVQARSWVISTKTAKNDELKRSGASRR